MRNLQWGLSSSLLLALFCTSPEAWASVPEIEIKLASEIIPTDSDTYLAQKSAESSDPPHPIETEILSLRPFTHQDSEAGAYQFEKAAVTSEPLEPNLSPSGTSTTDLTVTAPQPIQLAQVPPEAVEGEVEGDSVSTTATDLQVKPRINFDYNSSSGGVDGFGGVEGFYPVLQTPGESISYVVGRLNIFNDVELGANLAAGYRQIRPCLFTSGNCIFGSYVGLDVTDTGPEAFPQIGAGLEMLGDIDLRLNAYVPIGDTRRSIGDSRLQVSNIAFQGNNLLLDTLEFTDFQAALTRIDLEAGKKILDLPGAGELKGIVGTYYQDGKGVTGGFGFRTRLDAHINSLVTVSGGVQHDDIFGTNLLFRARFSLPLPYQRKDRRLPVPLVARLGDPLERQNGVVVDDQIETSSQTGIVATDAATGTAFTFLHVDPATGNAAGSGVFEDPTDTVANVVGAAVSGDIIYVQAGAAGGSFTILDGVEVRSVGPVQQVNTQFGLIQLPGSGSNNFPTLSDTVTFGSNTLLSGFDVTGVSDSALFIPMGTTGTVDIEDNFLTSTVDDGIEVEEIIGNLQLTIVRNEITGTNDKGILVEDPLDNATVDITISDNIITATGDDGIEVGPGYTNAGNVNVDVTVTNNVISDSGDDGIDISGKATYAGTLVSNVTVTGNQVTNSADDGIDVGITYTAYGNIDSDVTITGNTVTNSGEYGIFVGAAVTVNGVIDADVTISDNAVESSGEDGISVGVSYAYGGSVTTNVAITGNTISYAGDDGIYVGANLTYYGTVAATVAISGNTISNTNDEGIEVGGNYSYSAGSLTSNVSITGNTIADVGENGIYINGNYTYDGAITADVVISDNIITNTGENGIYIGENVTYDGTITTNVVVSGNTITSAVENGIYIGDSYTFYGEIVSNVAISGNTITDSGEDGVIVGGNYTYGGDITSDVAITGNTITNSAQAGIYVNSMYTYYGTITATVAITGNTLTNNDEGIILGTIDSAYDGDVNVDVVITDNEISNNLAEGIYLEEVEGYAVVTATISDNVIEQNGAAGILINANDDSIVDLIVERNTIQDNAGPGVLINGNNNAQVCLQISDNVSINPGNDGFVLNNATGLPGNFEVVNLPNVTTINTGTFNPIDPDASGDFTNAAACP